MRLIRFKHFNKIKWGALEGETIKVLKNSPFGGISFGRSRVPLRDARILAPAEASKIILAGLNYKDHARELGMKLPGEPVIFLKPPSSLLGHCQNIVYPPQVSRLDYEAELALVIKKSCYKVSEGRAKEYILGYTCLNDVTARNLQKKDGQWTRAKSFDTFCPLGPWLQTALNPGRLSVRSYLNGEIRQDSNTRNFIFPVDFLVAFISRVMTLNPGDVISTGTPAGIGQMKPGDTVEVEIEGIGRLKNFIIGQK